MVRQYTARTCKHKEFDGRQLSKTLMGCIEILDKTRQATPKGRTAPAGAPRGPLYMRPALLTCSRSSDRQKVGPSTRRKSG
jgi:hypothetical protein